MSEATPPASSPSLAPVPPAAPAPRAAWPAEARLLAGLSVTIVAAWLVTSLLGGREATSVLTGTAATTGGSLLLGALHVLLHLALVLVAPVLALAAVLRAGLERLAPPRGAGSVADHAAP